MDLSQIQQRLPKTLSSNQEYRTKVQDLFRLKDTQEISPKHLNRNIITNPKCFFNLVESNFLVELKTNDTLSYYELKWQIMNYIKFLLEDFPLNAKFIYEEAFLVIQNNVKINFVTYLVKDIANVYDILKKEQEKCKKILHQYIDLCTSLFYDICTVCTLRTSELKLITNSLAQAYYDQYLSVDLIAHCFRLLDAGLQERAITPYLYFIDNSKSDSVKVLLPNNKWPFSKGMTLFMWISAFKQNDCRLFWLKTEDKNQLIIKVKEGKLIVESLAPNIEENHCLQICDFPINTLTSIGVELQPISEGLFKSSSYHLSLSVNGKEYKNLDCKIPKFENHQFVIEYSLLLNFIGALYSVIITTKPELSALEELCKFSQYGICKQSLVWQMVDRKILKIESILCVFNSERYFEGFLLNYVHEKNHACYEGRVSSVKYHKYDSKIVDIYMPFLYLMTIVKERDQKWGDLFDLILQYLLTIIGKEHISTRSVLLILLFLEMNQYSISQSTLNLLYESSKEHDNYYIDLLVKYMEPHALIAKGLFINKNVEPFDDPVEKSILMFYLETLWQENWNWLQGFEGWWSPFFFRAQKDHPYNPKDYLFDQTREGRVEWQVMNFVTKDYCKCLVKPIFKLPQFGVLNKYQNEYVGKESFVEEFKMQLFKKKKGEVLICDKISSSSLDRLKNKILRATEQESNKKKQSQFKQFSSPCIYIDILTIVEGIVRITKEGVLIFSAQHKNKRFDHMCIKGFKNEYFMYVSFSLNDVRKVYKKRFNATNNAIYIKLKDGKEYMLHFYEQNVDSFLSVIGGAVKVKKDAFGNYVNSQQPFHWIDKCMSNYQYLQWLNEIAGRSYTDMTQYPVLPWTLISNSPKLDNQEKNIFRDLSKNMGLQGDPDRIRYFQEKYHSDNKEELFSEYHFGTHYSSSAIIFNFLIRIRPYSIGALTLQSGNFDVADRIFYNFCGSWNNAISSPTDLRELIPQIYTLPEMFINENNYQYGLTQEKVVVDNVILPAWSDQNPYKFVSELRRGLQSRYVSDNINSWIDLIYGYKQRGKDAVENMNIFYPLTYEHCIDLNKVKDPDQLQSFETQIAHFGQNPSQIIGNNPHPKRLAAKAYWQDKLLPDGNQLLIRKCLLSKTKQTEEGFIFKSVLQGSNCILGIKFIGQDLFFVLRKHEYYLFQILNEKGNFLSKEQEVNYELQSVKVSLNYKELATFLPITCINHEVMIVGGFYNGQTQLIFIKQNKYNRSFRFPTSTITALAYHQPYHYLYIADSEGYLRLYEVTLSSRKIQFENLKLIKAHDSKINHIGINQKANLVTVCSEDGTLSLCNAYSMEIVRTLKHPSGAPIHLAHITTSPLYAVVFYSKDNSTIYVYSINGQLLDSFCQKTGFIYNMSILRGTNSTQSLVYLNAQRELFIWDLPFLGLKRKVKVKKDEFRISCFETCFNSKIAVAGTEDGGLQIIANPDSF